MRFREIKNIGQGYTAGSGSVCLNSHSSCYNQSARTLLRGAMQIRALPLFFFLPTKFKFVMMQGNAAIIRVEGAQVTYK